MKHCVYLVIYSLFHCCQLVSWWLTGVQSHLKSCRNGENYESSSQLLRVWFCSSGGVINVSVGKVQCETTTIIGFTTAEIFSILFLTLYDVISYH
ncbi:hypothetical protein EB796_008178 [Bugula neritina]|uniref:Uncharacterized protein n=1 Tax=Bugula neritina TaxID=10212 RepID=A0A7J7K7I3_BUGNE|nr:hypothetical protein EB796_008178 [Bugula neritina]